MAVTTDTRTGIKHGWADNDDNWGAAMNSNLELISRLGFHPYAKSATTPTPPQTPAEGDSYIVPSNATDGWTAHVNALAVWVSGAWVFYTPKVGYKFEVSAANNTLNTYRFDGTSWAIVSTGTTADPDKPLIITVTASRSLAATDTPNYLRSTSATAVTLTIPSGAVFTAGDVISGVQRGAGAVTIAAASGVTLNIPTGHTAVTRAVGSAWSIICVGSNEFDLTGDLAVSA